MYMYVCVYVLYVYASDFISVHTYIRILNFFKMNTTYVCKILKHIDMLKIHVTLHLMLEVRNKDYVNCITYLRMYM